MISIPNFLGKTSSFLIFSGKNYPQLACFGKVMPKSRRGPVFWDMVYEFKPTTDKNKIILLGILHKIFRKLLFPSQVRWWWVHFGINGAFNFCTRSSKEFSVSRLRQNKHWCSNNTKNSNNKTGIQMLKTLLNCTIMESKLTTATKWRKPVSKFNVLSGNCRKCRDHRDKQE